MKRTNTTPSAEPLRPGETLEARRMRLLGPTYSLFYRQPVHPVRGEGVWLTEADGTRYLDAYNNVASVGHCHPHVVAALSRQAARLNTHTRYLDEKVLELAEKLLATAPPYLGHVLFTCTGSEANDLAVRIARHATGGEGVIVTEWAYHGNTTATAAFSPAAGGKRVVGRENRAVPAPDTFREGGCDALEFLANVRIAIEDMRAANIRPAALLLDGSFSSDGIFLPDPKLIAAAGDTIHSAGGLLIADEVQAGYGRLGKSLWGFEHYGTSPDIVTMGKPMGDGHPLAGVMARPELLEGFGASDGYFNTFGGNPVSAAVGVAVLEVIEQEGLIANARRSGERLLAGLSELKHRHDAIADIRVMGLYCGVEIAEPDGPGSARSLTAEIVEGMRRACVLIGSCGPHGNVLKIRPPLPFSTDNADLLVATLDRVLSALPSPTRERAETRGAAPC